MFDQILVPTHPTGRGDIGIISERAKSDVDGDRRAADVPSDK